LLSPLFGVDSATHTITFPGSGATVLSHTALADIGVFVADALVTGRGRNAVVYTATATTTYAELASRLDAVTGHKWARVTQATSEREAEIGLSPNTLADFLARFFVFIPNNPQATAWPVDKTYNAQHKLPGQTLDQVIRKTFTS